ncbi:hypothetical protein TIFTF001_034926 [Ficus carica]|uniref:Uncharacterized protein n=1 Tax=Ficus carica TaxID=3494 RepID=A0AA88J5T4_FICCA|nr:hypothetical protein TIFTF001_034926 [Ficus carica]
MGEEMTTMKMVDELKKIWTETGVTILPNGAHDAVAEEVGEDIVAQVLKLQKRIDGDHGLDLLKELNMMELP